MLTAEQKIRQTITGNPVGDVHFQHEGEQSVRILSGGNLPKAWVTFHPQGDTIEVRCAGCKNVLGHLPADDEPDETVQQLTAIRLSGHENHKPADWPLMNIIR
jgi:hypothetical protein